MCISNVGNRRPYGATAMGRPAAAASSMDSSLLPTLQLKQGLDMSFFQNNETSNSDADVPREPQNAKKNNPHIIVQHDYHDHANDNRADYQEDQPARGGVTTPFPLRLHEMLDNIANDGHDGVISWQPHGRCFVIHKPKEFSDLLPHYFKLSKLASFQRQLNLYGFQRLTRGRDRGGYYHELFLKNRVFLSHNILRLKVKGTGVRARSNPEQEPDFWTMPFVDGSVTPPLSSPVQSPVLEKSIAQLPLDLEIPHPSPIKEDNDIVCDAFEKNFHYLDPFQPTSGSWTVNGVDQLLATEAETFFEDFDFPEDIGNEIEDDDVFGDILEQMIA